MPKRVIDSSWREIRWDRYGELMQIELPDIVGHDLFSVQQVADKCNCICHLSRRNRYDIAVAICRELEEREQLSRQGRLYYFPERSPRHRVHVYRH